MGYRTILAAISGGTASEGVTELSCRLAHRFGAHVEGFHVRIDPRAVIAAAADGLGMPVPGAWFQEMLDRMGAEAAALAARTRASFEAAAARHGLLFVETPAGSGASAAWSEEKGYAPALVAQRARFHDLAVLGRSERVIDQPYTDTIEETLFRCGRPILLAPARGPTAIGETVAVGWSDTPETIRALASALPFLAAARTVSIIAIGDGHLGETALVVDYLAWHGIAASRRSVMAKSGMGMGEHLLIEAHDLGADLLVMGGYGHKRWRELLFGGATRDVIGKGALAVLLSH
ncbi:MAG TPA: universal stress protein [Alphaproteobacteria bacterium]|nr:universal stress protein [Alphaproteobacteria bacterium]